MVALVHHLPIVGAVVEHLVDVALVDKLAVFAGDALATERLRRLSRAGREL
jgi:hypothetical protein